MSIRKITHYAIGPVGGALLGFITLPCITWLFRQEDVANYSLLHVSLSLFTIILVLGLDRSYVRYFHDVEDKKGLFFSCFSTPLVIATAVAICLLFTPTTKMIFGTDSEAVRFSFSLCVWLSLIIRFLSLILRMYEEALLFSFAQLLPKVLFVMCLGFVFAGVNAHFENLLLFYSSSLLLATMWLFCKLWKSQLLSFSCSGSINKDLYIYGAPLIFAGIVFWGLSGLSRFSLKNYSSYEELSIFAVASSFASAGVIVQSVFSTVWAPMVYKWVAENRNLEKIHVINNMTLTMVIFCFCCTGLLSFLATWIVPEQYSAIKYIIPACMSFPLFYTLSEASGIGINIAKKPLYNLFSSILAFIVNVGCLYFLVPIWGAKGAAVSLVVTFWVFLASRTILSASVYKTCHVVSTLAMSLLVSIVCVLQVFEVFYYSFLWMLLLTFLVFRNKNLIWRLLRYRSLSVLTE